MNESTGLTIDIMHVCFDEVERWMLLNSGDLSLVADQQLGCLCFTIEITPSVLLLLASRLVGLNPNARKRFRGEFTIGESISVKVILYGSVRMT